MKKIAIDCNEPAKYDFNFQAREHWSVGLLELDSLEEILLHPMNQLQKDWCDQRGNHNATLIRRSLRGLPLLNENVFTFITSNRGLIPEKWKGKNIFFLGTLYYEYRRECLLDYINPDKEERIPFVHYIKWLPESYWVRNARFEVRRTHLLWTFGDNDYVALAPELTPPEVTS